jgi:hypothetical protein
VKKVKKLIEVGPRLCLKDKLALIGTADPTRKMAPWDDKAYEIWGVSVAITYEDVLRLDVHYEMHPREYWEKDVNIKNRLIATKEPIYMLEKYEDIPTSMRFPIEVAVKYRKYFTSSIAYMLGMAYHSFVTTGKPKRVELYGIHMAAAEEYMDQRPACEYWIGRMEGAGMSVDAGPDGALLISMGLYGYEKYNPVCWDMRQRTQGLSGGMAQATAEIKRWELQKAKNEGAMFECEFWLRKFQRGEL